MTPFIATDNALKHRKPVLNSILFKQFQTEEHQTETYLKEQRKTWRKKDHTCSEKPKYVFQNDEVTHSRILWYNTYRGSGQLNGHRTHNCW